MMQEIGIKTIEELYYKLMLVYSESEYTYDNIPSGEVKRKIIHHFNKEGKEIECVEYYYDKLSSKRIIFYDERGKELENTQYDADGSIDEIMMYKYDINGNIVEYEFQYRPRSGKPNDECSFKVISTFNIKGEKIESRRFDSNDCLEHNYVYKYDEKGREIECKVLLPKGELEKISTYKYDTFGNRIEQLEHNPMDKVISRIERQYDEKGRETKYIKTESKKTKIIERRYRVFDEKENWIEMQVFHDNNLVDFIRRKIEFHEG